MLSHKVDKLPVVSEDEARENAAPLTDIHGKRIRLISVTPTEQEKPNG